MEKTNPELIQASLPIGGPSAEMRVDTKPFDDIRVRKALNMAIDRPAMAEGIYGGTATGVPCGYASQAAKGYSFAYEDWPQELKDEYTYNPTRAKELLAEAGYPNGFKTNIITNASGTQLNVMQAIKAYFLDIGVDLEIKVYAGPAWAALVQSGKQDQMVQGNRSGADTSPFSAMGMRTSKNAGNWHFNNDATYDAIVDEMNSATTMEEARQLVIKADRYGIEQHWNVPTFQVSNFTIYQPYLKGYSGEILGRNPGWIFSRLWVDQSAK
jgi:peptide/nickel transport system substrate-binding protein